MSNLCIGCGKPIVRPQDGVSNYDGSSSIHYKCPAPPLPTPQSELDRYWFEFLHYWKERNSLPTQDAYWKWYIINKLEES